MSRICNHSGFFGLFLANFVLIFLDFFIHYLLVVSLENDVDVASKSHKQNFLVVTLKVTDENTRIRIRILQSEVRIRIRSKMSRIRNTVFLGLFLANLVLIFHDFFKFIICLLYPLQ
jgi:hypothetical protein